MSNQSSASTYRISYQNSGLINESSKSKVYFIGAGPGDPDLLTLKAAKILALAEVVIADRLVSEEIIQQHVSPDAVIITVGKQGGSNASISQREINRIILRFASAYTNVVRLKGGDISLYSNVLDELETVKAEGIAYEIIPGITALSGAAAYTGVPLTARGYSSGVRILTYYKDTIISDETWKQLAAFEETLVLYMSANTLPAVAEKLLSAGADKNTPLLVIEQATTPLQHVFHYTLKKFSEKKLHETYRSPSLVIIGKVADLYKQFAWLPNNSERKSHFQQLQEYPELIEIINEIQNTTEHVSRA